MNNLYLIDCMEFMKDKPDKFYDLAIVDPPYGIERFKKGGSVINKYGDEKRKWNNEKPPAGYWTELFRISKYQIIWGANNFELPTSEYFIIWDKVNPENFSFAMCEMAWTNVRKPAKIFKYNNREERIHPTQKPVALYKWLLKNYAKEGGKLLDTHSGSGSFRIAAYDMGFDLDSCELDKDYFEANEKRFNEYVELDKQQLKLF